MYREQCHLAVSFKEVNVFNSEKKLTLENFP